MTTIARRVIPGEMTLEDCRAILRDGAGFAFADGWRKPVEDSARTVADVIAGDRTVYGVNTGFGLLASTSIPKAKLRELQLGLVRSHAAGVGAPLPRRVVRLVLALKANALARGFSGVRPAVVEFLLAMIDCDVLPHIPAKGSVGASGDLAPLAHLSLVMIGEGAVLGPEGEARPGAEALREAGLSPLALEPKEGLALLNGTQVSTALALDALVRSEALFVAALVAGALSIDAIKGSDTPFDERLHALRGQPGQIRVAGLYRALVRHSRIRDSHLLCDRVQDPYSIRCQPQVMGACLDQINAAAATLVREANAVSDNPIVFSNSGDILSGGNFHAEPVAFSADGLALAIAETGSLSERRTALLIDPHLSGLPPFLVDDAGLKSGFMLAQVSAAALVSENKALAHPASVDSLPTSANQEDHVSMATFAARRLGDMLDNAVAVIAIELLAAAQGVEFHRPLESSAPLEAAIARIRERVPRYLEDRSFAPDIATVAAMIEADAFADLVPGGFALAP
ncbi:histidine ammonia-lyase [Oceanibacterium hippocampi]|uniref:Histidine ammonia-lyase n=1 Tax=Oceanibacterium hippocampi TaxID=745714 RepID=A0A1Y5R8C0_9PROT|nr:histidine ammonia-lyase [Oceanibacterium hippocampi]SLN11514.1 Histidine ammonia-lyase [Oceanibacterium hippocampi]